MMKKKYNLLIITVLIVLQHGIIYYQLLQDPPCPEKHPDRDLPLQIIDCNVYDKTNHIKIISNKFISILSEKINLSWHK